MVTFSEGFKKKTEKNKKEAFRLFTIQALLNCEMLILTIEEIHKMKIEFPDVFDDLFSNALRHLKKSLQLKIDAIKSCEKVNQISHLRSMRQTNILDNLNEIENQANCSKDPL